jgi:hypothetical protein
MRKWILWIPVLMVGSMMYWTVALNFGNLSLLALSAYTFNGAGDEAADLRDSYQPITVQIPGVESTANGTADDDSVDVEVVSDRDHDPVRSDQRRAVDLQGRPDPGPGETAF